LSDATLTNDKASVQLSSSSTSDSDQPLSQRMSVNNSSQKILDPKKRKIKTESNTTVTNESSDSEDDVALSKRRKTSQLKVYFILFYFIFLCFLIIWSVICF